MYGNAPAEFPRRIVCLSTEHVEICYALGAGDRGVGAPGTARRPPAARDKPKVGAFTSFRLDRIRALGPDLALAFSDLQADVGAELIRAGIPVFCTNPRSVDEVMQSILTVGGVIGAEPAARALGLGMPDEINPLLGVPVRRPGPPPRVLRGVARSAHHRDPLGVRADRAGGRARCLQRSARPSRRARPGGRARRGGPPRSPEDTPR